MGSMNTRVMTSMATPAMVTITAELPTPFFTLAMSPSPSFRLR